MNGLRAGWMACALMGAVAVAWSETPAATGGGPVVKGTVASALSGGRYSYIEVATGTGSVWVACYEVAAQKGDPVTVQEGRVMEKFTSPSLNRTFDQIVFASRLQVGTNQLPAQKALPAGHPPVGGHSPHGAGEGAAAPHGAMAGGSPHGGMGGGAPHGDILRGEVLETMDGGGYTYVQVRTADQTVWAAANKFKVSKGDRVIMASGMVMKDFESPSLNRKFASIHFVDKIEVDDASPAAATPAKP